MNKRIQPLIEQLRHPDKSTRMLAIFALDRIDHPNKLSLLIDALRVEDDVLVGEDITYAVMNMQEAALETVIALLQDSDPRMRHYAAHILGKIGNDAALHPLIDTLRDSSAQVVHKAVLALQQVGDAVAVPALIGVLAHDDADVQTSLLEALEHFGTEALPHLVAALEHHNPLIRERAADCLAVIRNPEAIPALAAALQDPVWQVRFAVLTALGMIGGDAAFALVRELAPDEESLVNGLRDRLVKRMMRRTA